MWHPAEQHGVPGSVVGVVEEGVSPAPSRDHLRGLRREEHMTNNAVCRV